jgi:SsrA-binding protein
MNIITKNKKAFHNYEISEKIEAGIILQGCEVKSIREHKVRLSDSFAKVVKNELWLLNCHINPYKGSTHITPDPLRNRKLLLHKKQVLKLASKIQEKGFTLVPLKLYIKDNLVKIELGLGKAKKLFDKRKTLKEKSVNREIQKGLKSR